MAGLLDHRRAWIVICASEGGLFEYGHDRDILSNLKALHGHPSDRLRVAGTIFRDIETVDPTLPAMADMTGGGLRFLGVQGLENLL